MLAAESESVPDPSLAKPPLPLKAPETTVLPAPSTERRKPALSIVPPKERLPAAALKVWAAPRAMSLSTDWALDELFTIPSGPLVKALPVTV